MSLNARFCLLLEAESPVLCFLRLCYREALIVESLTEEELIELLKFSLNLGSKFETANMVWQATSFLSDPSLPVI